MKRKTGPVAPEGGPLSDVPELPDFDLTPFRRKTPKKFRPAGARRAQMFSEAPYMTVQDPIPFHRFMFCVAGPVVYFKSTGKDLFLDVLRPAHRSKNLIRTLFELSVDVPFGFLIREEAQAQCAKLFATTKSEAKKRILRRFSAYCGAC
jgi:hypothetical protein